jgi:hypothetical protein
MAEVRKFLEKIGAPIDAVGMKVVERAEAEGRLRQTKGRRKRREHVVEVVAVHCFGTAPGNGGPFAAKPAPAEIPEDQDTKRRFGLRSASNWLRFRADIQVDRGS